MLHQRPDENLERHLTGKQRQPRKVGFVRRRRGVGGMRLEENVVRCAVLSDDPRHVIALLLFARSVLMARSDDDQVAFGRSVEQGGDLS